MVSSVNKYYEIDIPEKESHYERDVYYDAFGDSYIEGFLIIWSPGNIWEEYDFNQDEFEAFIGNCFRAEHGVYN